MIVEIDCPQCGAFYATIEAPQRRGYYIRHCSHCLAQWVDDNGGRMILKNNPIFIDSQGEDRIQTFHGKQE
jgi:hypothetical protein